MMAWLLRWTVFVILVCLSLAAPIGIVAWVWHAAFGDKMSESFANDYHIYNTTAVHDHELWYFSMPIVNGAYFDNEVRNVCHVRRLNLETGEDLATPISLEGDECQLFWLNGSLYIFSGQFSDKKSLSRWDGTSLIQIPDVPTTDELTSADPFVFQGRLTMISEFQPTCYRLRHLEQDRWIDGPEIVIPTKDQFVALYSAAGQAFIQMYLNNGQRSFRFRFQNRNMSEQPRLVLADVTSSYKVYRDQFQFVDPPGDTASAMSPENAPTLLWNWSAYDPDEHQVFVANSMQLPDSELLLLEDGRLMQQRPDEDMQEVPVSMEPFGPQSFGSTHLLTTEDGSAKYLLFEDGTNLQRVSIHRIEGSRILPAHVQLPGVVNQYLNRWKQLLIGIVVAWATHMVMMIVSLEWILRRRPSLASDQDLLKLHLASVTRRATALLIDTTIAVAVLLPVCLWGVVWPEVAGEHWCEVLRGIEWSAGELFNEIAYDWEFFWQNFGMTWNMTIEEAKTFCETVLPSPTQSPLSFVAIAVWPCLLLFLRCRFEGQSGVTPGKWLLRIQTVRSDQRPTGFARSLLRTVLLSIELIMFVTPLPAVISLLWSRKNQRLGDRLADTVVICKSTGVA